ncbi:hypothetical protein [Mangrovimonas sp. DI 80]|uniref:hypothetical protein n=1 Tax=Mangrovimonas sp. DI 80 TaxID=1779330 RepID=UPI000F4E45B7|nr:hypothetical protein [Mangrovimonas sp. DI 80]
MHKTLIVQAFEKAKEQMIVNGTKSPSKVAISKELSLYLEDECQFPFGEKSLRNYYNEAQELENSEADISINQLAVINGLCSYIGYSDYSEFNNSLCETKPKVTNDNFKFLQQKKLLTTSIIGILFIIGFYSYESLSSNKQRWMVWDNDHYIEASFDTKLLTDGILKLYKEERIENFKKLDSANCNTSFFNNDGSAKVWYWKTSEGNLELYTALGKHPKTGKTLKPITKYMIRKYICPNY